MKKLLLIVLAGISMSSCRHVTGSGVIVKENRSVSSFKSISVSTGIGVELKKGPVSVVVETDDNLQKYLETDVEGNTLYIGIKPNTSIHNGHFMVYVSAELIEKLNASSAGHIEVVDLLSSPNQLALDASSSGHISLEADAPEIKLGASSAGNIDIKGRTRNLKVNASSAGSVNAKELLCENAVAEASSGASVHIHASVEIDANASSGGHITYTGGGKVNVHSSSGGSVSESN